MPTLEIGGDCSVSNWTDIYWRAYNLLTHSTHGNNECGMDPATLRDKD